MLVRQINEGRSEVENQYIRAVTETGNVRAQAEMAEIFETRETFEWRGLGWLPDSALRLKAAYERYDAEKRFGLVDVPARDNPACECGAILRGVKKPRECKLFGAALHARHADGLVHGLARGRLLGALDLWALSRSGESRAATEERRLSAATADPPQARPEERPRRSLPRRRRARDGAVDRGHFSRRLRQRLAARGQRPVGLRRARRAHGDDDRRLCRHADLLSRRRHRLARRARHDQRHRDGGRASALSLRELHHRGGLPARRLEAHRDQHGRGLARSGRADHHRRHQGRRARQGGRRVHLDRRASASRRRASASPATRRGPAISSRCRARSATTASR